MLLVAAAFAAGAVDGDDRGAGGGLTAAEGAGQTISVTPEGADTAGLSGVALEIAEALPAMMRFVEEKRGLQFKEPVEVTLLGDKAFRARLQGLQEEETEDDRAQIETNARVLKALGLLEGDVDLAEATESLLGDAVAGFYDTENDDLVVRGEELSGSVKVTFVHELTHALQDQYFELDREDIEERDDEASQAFTSLIEGDAVRIEELYRATLPEREQKAIEREEMNAAGGIDPSVPRILLELLSFPYAVGPQFATAVVAEGGQERLDAAFREPPTTSEQILNPDRYLADGAPPRILENPKADGKIIDQGVIGQLGMILILQRILDDDDAFVASDGWGGDRYVAWRSGDKTCVRTNLVMDTATDAREMADALRRAARQRKSIDASITPALLTFTSCN
ncbi:MAG TPA: hypothetical protein VM345_13400 [Acidimicrobiales bacterium]|nr:hypothetical protein [Acidimicrobiales bacterium]